MTYDDHKCAVWAAAYGAAFAIMRVKVGPRDALTLALTTEGLGNDVLRKTAQALAREVADEAMKDVNLVPHGYAWYGGPAGIIRAPSDVATTDERDPKKKP